MEGSKREVTVFGIRHSSCCNRVVLALKLKGVPYEYVEEDLNSKSELLLHYNPVHKKVPVLVHQSKPLAESLPILEYIDECWNQPPKLLPDDPYQRSKIRFWVQFYDQKIVSAILPIIESEGEEREKAIEEFNKLLSVFEEGTKKDFPGEFEFFCGDNLGLLEIVVGVNACNYEAFQQVIGEVIGPEKNPAFFSKVKALKEHPLMKETIPPHQQLVAKMADKYLKKPRENLTRG